MIAEGKHTACITVSHIQREEKVAIPAIRQILLNAHTPAACIKTNKDPGRHKDTDTYAHMCRNSAQFLDIFYYSNAPVRLNEHSLSSSFRERERERDQPGEERDIIANSGKPEKS